MENSASPTVISRRRALTVAGGVVAGAALAAQALRRSRPGRRTPTRSSLRWPRRSGRDGRTGRRGAQGTAPGPGTRVQPGRPGVLVLRRSVPDRLRRTAADGNQGLPRTGVAGLAGHGRLRPRCRRPGRSGLLGPQVGRGVCGLRRGGEAVLALRAGDPLVPDRGLGRARRRPRGRTRQLGAPLPCHLGYRYGRGRAVREAGAGRGREREGDLQVPAPRRRDRAHRRCRDGCAWRGPRAQYGGARQGQFPHGGG